MKDLLQPAVSAAIFLGGCIFGAGGMAVRQRIMERNLNGIGKKAMKGLIAQLCEAEDKATRWKLAHFFYDL